MYHLSPEELEFLQNLVKVAIASPAVLNAILDILGLPGTQTTGLPDAASTQTTGLPDAASLIPVDAECFRLFSSIFLGTGEKISLIPAQHKDKPNFVPSRYIPKQTHVEDIFTRPSLRTASAFVKMFEAYNERVIEVDRLKAIKGDGNLVVVGSPTSNVISRIALGYKENGNGVDGAKYTPREAFDLKIRYALDKSEIESLIDSSHHYVDRDEPKGDIATVLNWGAIKSDGTVCLPETRDKKLLQDYLLITCLPNTFNKKSYEAGHRLINIGGAHREGTLAAEKLFTNKEMLTELSSSLKVEGGKKADTRFWQALILVDSNPITGEVSPNRIMEYKPVTVVESAVEAMVQANHEALINYGGKP